MTEDDNLERGNTAVVLHSEREEALPPPRAISTESASKRYKDIFFMWSDWSDDRQERSICVMVIAASSSVYAQSEFAKKFGFNSRHLQEIVNLSTDQGDMETNLHFKSYVPPSVIDHLLSGTLPQIFSWHSQLHVNSL